MGRYMCLFLTGLEIKSGTPETNIKRTLMSRRTIQVPSVHL